MSEELHKGKFERAVEVSFRRFLPSIVRLAAGSDISLNRFLELVKKAYVDVITEDCGVDGKPANLTTTASKTGLSKQEVRALRDDWDQSEVTNAQREDYRLHLLANLAFEWSHNHRWHDEDGNPKVLDHGPPNDSFDELVRKYFGAVPTTAVLRELKILGTVKETIDGKIRLLRDHYLSPPGEVKHAQRLGAMFEDFLSNAVFNTYRDPSQLSRIEFRASEPNVPKALEAEFRSYINMKAQELCSNANIWLNERRLDFDDESQEVMRMGVGVYQIGDK